MHPPMLLVVYTFANTIYLFTFSVKIVIISDLGTGFVSVQSYMEWFKEKIIRNLYKILIF